MEAYGADINDRSRLLPGGKQRILMDGYQMSLEFKNGLAYLRCRKPTDEELCSLPHVIMTSDIDWDPSLNDNIIENIEEFHDTSIDDHEDPNFDQYGEYRHHTVAKHNTLPEAAFFDAMEYIEFDDFVGDLIDVVNPEGFHDVYVVNDTDIKQVKPNFELLRPLFGWTPAETIKKNV